MVSVRLLVEALHVAEAAEIELQRLALDQLRARRVVDHQVREIGLAGHGAERGEFRRGEAHEIEQAADRGLGTVSISALSGEAGGVVGVAELAQVRVFSHRRHHMLIDAAMTYRVAIVGAGPSAASMPPTACCATRPDLRIDLIDRLPTPFGLVRAGVAPDHQGTKAVIRQFERLLAQPDVRFAGNVEIGRDVSWEELQADYDAVIVATGMVIDSKLGVPGEELPFVWGSWRFVGWLNGHPDFRDGPDLSQVKRVAVIGNGNVALDVARVLAKSADEMAKSDIVPEAGAAIAAAPLTDITIIGRRGPEQASFTNNELAEMGRLARAVALVDPAALEGRGAGGRSDARAAAQGQEPRDPARLCRQQAGQQADHAAFRLQPADQGDQAGRVRPRHHLHRLRRRALPQGRGRVCRRLGQARAERHHPDQSRREPCGGPAGAGLAEGSRPQERTRSDAARRSISRAGIASTRPRSPPAPKPAGLA